MTTTTEMRDLLRAVVHEAAQHAIEHAAEESSICDCAAKTLWSERDRLTAEVVEACFGDHEGDGPVDRLLAAITQTEGVSE